MSAMARCAASVVLRLKVVTVRIPTRSRTSDRTAGMSMIARVMLTSNGRSRPGADDPQANRGARGAAHPLDRLVEGAAIEQLAVDMGDEVARLDPGAVGGGVAGRRDHLHGAVLHRDGEAEAAIIAVGGAHQVLEAARVEIGGVRIEAVEHSVDGAADQALVVDLVDIFGAHALQHADELVDSCRY